MDPPTTSGRSDEVCRESLRRSRNVWDHQGFLVQLVGKWRRAGHLRNFSHDEVLNVSILEGDRLLRIKFDPERGTATTCLSMFLFSRVQYALLTKAGNKKTQNGWIDSRRITEPARQREPKPHEETDWQDLIEAIHPDLKSVVIRLGEGMTLDEILDEDGSVPLFDTHRERSRDELLTIIRHEVSRLTR